MKRKFETRIKKSPVGSFPSSLPETVVRFRFHLSVEGVIEYGQAHTNACLLQTFLQSDYALLHPDILFVFVPCFSVHSLKGDQVLVRLSECHVFYSILGFLLFDKSGLLEHPLDKNHIAESKPRWIAPSNSLHDRHSSRGHLEKKNHLPNLLKSLHQIQLVHLFYLERLVEHGAVEY